MQVQSHGYMNIWTSPPTLAFQQRCNLGSNLVKYSNVKEYNAKNLNLTTSPHPWVQIIKQKWWRHVLSVARDLEWDQKFRDEQTWQLLELSVSAGRDCIGVEGTVINDSGYEEIKDVIMLMLLYLLPAEFWKPSRGRPERRLQPGKLWYCRGLASVGDFAQCTWITDCTGKGKQ